MIKVRIYHQDNISSAEELIYEGVIHREEDKLREYRTYKAAMEDVKNGRALRSRIIKFPNRRLNALDLVFRALDGMVGHRNHRGMQSSRVGNRKGGRRGRN